MNDGINRNESELNERALDQVSGGFALHDDPRSRAHDICTSCRIKGGAHCTGNAQMLAEYMEQHGNIDGYYGCPYREK